MASIAQDAYKYNKFACSFCQCGSHLCYSITTGSLFFMCVECTSCLTDPIGDGVAVGEIMADQIFDVGAELLGEIGCATLGQIERYGLDQNYLYKNLVAGS